MFQAFENERVLDDFVQFEFLIEEYLHEIDLDFALVGEPVEILHFFLFAHPQVQLVASKFGLQLFELLVRDDFAKVYRLYVLTESCMKKNVCFCRF